MIVTPNAFAYLMLLVWPIVVWQFYRHLSPARALIWSMLGAYMLLPELLAIDLPALPDMNKSTLPAVSAAVASWMMLGRRLHILPQGRLGQILIVMFVISPFMTVLTNPEPLVFASGFVVPGMRIYDSVAEIGTQSLYVLPLFLARRDLATAEAMRDLLRALVVAAMIYAVPMIVKSRLSPQLHIWLYGYFQHDFVQSIRFGGYRPFVFMPHGLWVAFFALMCLMASATLLRMGPAERRPWQFLAFLLCGFLLSVCKSFGPLAYAIFALPVLFLAKPRQIILIAASLSAVVIIYPLLRGMHLVPVDKIMDVAQSLSADRAQSFGFRLMNEEALLGRAADKPWFGWGGYGRNFLHDTFSGEQINIADGAWIIQIGTYGWMGFLAQFGLLCLPLWLLAREAIARGASIAPEVATVALIHALNLCDLLPNATLVPLTWLMAGALLGHAEVLRAARRESARLATVAGGMQPGGARTII